MTPTNQVDPELSEEAHAAMLDLIAMLARYGRWLRLKSALVAKQTVMSSRPEDRRKPMRMKKEKVRHTA